MTGKKYEPPLHIDMDFDEALERFVGVTPKEMHDNITRSKKRKPPGGKPPPGGEDDDHNVVKLRGRKMWKRNGC
jgi:hypothetical protein